MMREGYSKRSLTANEMSRWNYHGGIPKYTKEEHGATNSNVDEKRWWNIYGNTPEYTEEEVGVKIGSNTYKYTKEEIKNRETKKEIKKGDVGFYFFLWLLTNIVAYFIFPILVVFNNIFWFFIVKNRIRK